MVTFVKFSIISMIFGVSGNSRELTWPIEADCEAAIKEVQNGKLIRQATKDHHMDDGTICYVMKKVKTHIPLQKQTVKHTLLSKDLELNLDNCICTLCKVGFSSAKDDILDHSVHWCINPTSENTTPSFSPNPPPLNLQISQAPLFRQFPPLH